ncbi:hypothetical protein B0T25DRAFT_262213 [Lasiosphaeria hispida]|uniref:Uncharacterized protein n=1 Tax=Lasiosphaeria hispida TaxID=260671 RepID=A0AAJ0MDF6_9PEZI|nr:hypothetical protein B0T25DRAFT_262213 [Lasiosphaeria hispida]
MGNILSAICPDPSPSRSRSRRGHSHYRHTSGRSRNRSTSRGHGTRDGYHRRSTDARPSTGRQHSFAAPRSPARAAQPIWHNTAHTYYEIVRPEYGAHSRATTFPAPSYQPPRRDPPAPSWGSLYAPHVSVSTTTHPDISSSYTPASAQYSSYQPPDLNNLRVPSSFGAGRPAVETGERDWSEAGSSVVHTILSGDEGDNEESRGRTRDRRY